MGFPLLWGEGGRSRARTICVIDTGRLHLIGLCEGALFSGKGKGYLRYTWTQTEQLLRVHEVYLTVGDVVGGARAPRECIAAVFCAAVGNWDMSSRRFP